MNKPLFTSAEKEIAEMLHFYLSAARAQPPTRASGGPGELEKQARKPPEALPNQFGGTTLT
jgi:hypothetical protein